MGDSCNRTGRCVAACTYVIGPPLATPEHPDFGLRMCYVCHKRVDTRTGQRRDGKDRRAWHSSIYPWDLPPHRVAEGQVRDFRRDRRQTDRRQGGEG